MVLLCLSFFLLKYFHNNTLTSQGNGIIQINNSPGVSITSHTTIEKQESIAENKIFKFYCNTWIKNKQFTGRKQILDEINKLFSKNDQVDVLVLTGFPGIGKSQIANEYLHQEITAGKFDAAIWVDGSDEYRMFQSYSKILDNLYINNKNKEGSLNLEKIFLHVHNKLSKNFKNTLIVLDNLNTDDNNFYKYYSDLCKIWQVSEKAQVRIIITSTKSSWDKISAIQVNDFSIEEIREYVKKLCTIHYGENSDFIEDDKALFRIYQVFGGLPLIISQAMKYIQDNGITVENLIEIIDHHPNRIFNYPTYISDNYSATQLSLLQLGILHIINTNQNAAELLYIVSFLGSGKIPKKMLNKYFKDISKYQQAYSMLVNKSLLTDDGEYCKIHKVLQFVVNSLIIDQNLVSELCKKTIDILLTCLDFETVKNHSLTDINQIIYSSNILDYIGYIQNIFNYYEMHDLKTIDKNKLFFLTRILGEYHRSRRSGEIAINIWKFNADNCHDKKYEVLDLISVSEAYMQVGNYEKALPYAKKLINFIGPLDKKNKTEYIAAFKIIGSINLHIGNYNIARKQFQIAINAFNKSAGSEYELIYLKNMLALVTMYSGKYNEALGILLECENIFQRNDELNHFVRIFITNNIGFCKEFLGNIKEASDYFQKSYELAKLHENTNLSSHSIALTPLSNLGIIDCLKDKFIDAEKKLNTVFKETEACYQTLPIYYNNMVALGYYYYFIGKYDISFKLIKRVETILKNRKPSFMYLLSILLVHHLHEIRNEYALSIYYLQLILNVAKNIFGNNRQQAMRNYYNKYFTWEINPTTKYDKNYIRYLNKAMQLSTILYSKEHAVFYKYKYFKALYYINIGDLKKARKLLTSMPLYNSELITLKNVALVNDACSKVDSDTVLGVKSKN